MRTINFQRKTKAVITILIGRTATEKTLDMVNKRINLWIQKKITRLPKNLRQVDYPKGRCIYFAV